VFDQDGVGNDQSRKAFLTSLTPSHAASMKGVPSHGYTLGQSPSLSDRKPVAKRKVFNGNAYKDLKGSPAAATGRASELGNITEAAKDDMTPVSHGKSLQGVSNNLNKDL